MVEETGPERMLREKAIAAAIEYYNAVHKRHGHLFQDRFKSKMVDDERYLIALSAYVHNNPTDIKGYEEYPERYEYSSLSIYLGLRRDPYELIDDAFIMGIGEVYAVHHC
jgi:hypothetical protein